MDPNATLADLRRLTILLLVNPNNGDDAAVRMAELFEALDSWIARGGFLPQTWARDHA